MEPKIEQLESRKPLTIGRVLQIELFFVTTIL